MFLRLVLAKEENEGGEMRQQETKPPYHPPHIADGGCSLQCMRLTL
jgi:hypothetical protein